jgi:hypothetical protein
VRSGKIGIVRIFFMLASAVASLEAAAALFKLARRSRTPVPPAANSVGH